MAAGPSSFLAPPPSFIQFSESYPNCLKNFIRAIAYLIFCISFGQEEKISPCKALAGKPPPSHSRTGLCSRCRSLLFAAGENLRFKEGFTLRQTPHMSLPTPQVPPPFTDAPQPAPPVFFFGIQYTIQFFSFILTLPAGGCGVMTPGFWQVGVPQPMPG